MNTEFWQTRFQRLNEGQIQDLSKRQINAIAKEFKTDNRDFYKQHGIKVNMRLLKSELVS